MLNVKTYLLNVNEWFSNRQFPRTFFFSLANSKSYGKKILKLFCGAEWEKRYERKKYDDGEQTPKYDKIFFFSAVLDPSLFDK